MPRPKASASTRLVNPFYTKYYLCFYTNPVPTLQYTFDKICTRICYNQSSYQTIRKVVGVIHIDKEYIVLIHWLYTSYSRKTVFYKYVGKVH